VTAFDPRAALEHTWDALAGARGALDVVEVVGEDPVLTLVQTASGVARSEAAAFGVEQPKHVPVAGLDHATGYFAATGAMRALVDRHLLGGGRHVRCALAQTREWLETLGRIEGTTTPWPDDAATLEALPVTDSPVGRARTRRPAASSRAHQPTTRTAP
jgi:hypothetical protein